MAMTSNRTEDAEGQALLAFLAAQREAVLSIVAGLDEEAWHRSVVPSGWTPAGLVDHLGGAEWHWFQGVVAGKDPEPAPGDEDLTPYDPTAAFICDLPAAEIIGFYRDQCASSDAVLAVTPLSAPTGRAAGCALGRAAHDRGDRATCRSPGHRQGTDRRPDQARAALTGLTTSLPRVP
jgi:Protein of unknown function (DUF664)